MPKALIALIPLTLFAHSATAFAAPTQYSKLSGELTIAGKELADPPPGQKNDRVGLFLDGEGAKRVYLSMPVKVTNWGWCEVGLKMKQAGGLECFSHSNGSYECSVAIILATGQTRSIGDC